MLSARTSGGIAPLLERQWAKGPGTHHSSRDKTTSASTSVLPEVKEAFVLPHQNRSPQPRPAAHIFLLPPEIYVGGVGRITDPGLSCMLRQVADITI
jgi:hypothetical protein